MEQMAIDLCQRAYADKSIFILLKNIFLHLMRLLDVTPFMLFPLTKSVFFKALLIIQQVLQLNIDNVVLQQYHLLMFVLKWCLQRS